MTSSALLFVVLNRGLAANDAAARDLGTLNDGDVVWVEDSPCEVCVSRAVILQADQDAREADRLRDDLTRALTSLSLTEDALARSDAALSAAQATTRKLEGRPGFWSGTAVGSVVTLGLVLLLVLSS